MESNAIESCIWSGNNAESECLSTLKWVNIGDVMALRAK